MIRASWFGRQPSLLQQSRYDSEQSPFTAIASSESRIEHMKAKAFDSTTND
jgi:hypothetical protein